MEIIARVTTFDELRVALNMRKQHLRLKNLEVDEIAGLQTGYSSKIFAGMKRVGDMSLPALLGALGVELALVCASSTIAENAPESLSVARRSYKKVCAERAKKAADRRWLFSTEAEKRRAVKRMHKARIARARERRAAKAAAAEKAAEKECLSPVKSGG